MNQTIASILDRRRAALLVELYFQELSPQFLAKPESADFAFDYLVGFGNPVGGVNTLAIEVKVTEAEVQGYFTLSSKVYQFLRESNIPTLLVVADVKRNKLYYAFPQKQQIETRSSQTIKIPVQPLDDHAKHAITRELNSKAA